MNEVKKEFTRQQLKKVLKDIIVYIGDDSNREGLVETPSRILKAWDHIFQGYKQNPEKLFKTFVHKPSNVETYNQIILLKDIEMYSMCEHHMLPFFGSAYIGYIPNGKIIGISKLARLIEIYSRQLQIQERIGESITSDLMKYLEPKGAACIIKATHLCITMRGVQKQHSTMITSSLRGIFLDKIEVREELMRLVNAR